MDESKEPMKDRFLQQILELKHKEPYEKFKIIMTSGSAYLIEHPDLLAVGPSRIVYCIAKSERVVDMWLREISEIEATGEYLSDQALASPFESRST